MTTSNAAVLIPFTSLGKTPGLTPLPLTYFLWLAAILISYYVFGQMVNWYAKRCGYC